MIKDQFKVCPRCGKNVLKNKNICSFCGAIIKNKSTPAKTENGKKAKKYCAICGKPPTDETTCPNCGATGICAFHIYSFFQDQTDSPKGCPKCGPKCSSCGAQTSLLHFKGRALCSPCFDQFNSQPYQDKEKQRQNAETMKKVITTMFPVVGIAGGIYLGLQPEMQKTLMEIVKLDFFKGYVVLGAWGIIGFVAGSIIGSIMGSLIRE